MPDLSESQIETLEYIKDASALGRLRPLSAWETSFVSDIIERYEKYGASMFLSERQGAVLERIEEALVSGNPSRPGRR